MAFSNTAKPATARHGEPVSKIVGSGGRNDLLNSETPINLQARRLTRQFAFSIPVAFVLAGLAYGEDAR